MKLYDFQNGAFDQYLGQLIGATREAKAMQAVRRNVELIHTANITTRQLVIQQDGIFIRRENVPYRTYLYLGSYNVENYGLPKKHYFACEVVRRYASFIATNQDNVDIISNQSWQLHSNVKLSLCRYCADIFREQTAQLLLDESFDEFILQMACRAQAPKMPLDSNGYPLDFSEISTAFRRQKNYTCEKCHLTIKDPNDQKFIHTHHKDHNKSNNCIGNFQCLCIKCHSEVDALHRRNFDTPEQRRELRAFMEKYKSM